jgi:hypothetical protein
MASAKATQPSKKNLTSRMDWDIAEKVIALAKRRGTNASALIASTMADLVADA